MQLILETCNDAASRGHFDVLELAHLNGCSWNASNCAFAALGGHLEILQYLRQNGCEWNSITCAYAATD